ncbi:dimethylsulfoniopropionate lyase [Pararhizobium sp. YC-54]|uniref:dimethylsulfoniopropionate lyase n=1 Tax=Pararhizobium sp. YC-54 TaxID=2986920 RepID=UPI0021F7E083|nr:dimethylsulfoniopropionate lyase [Pararhizobium sp. YC-54]MCW0001581.1 dimethylsulfoniopropionate lyase [Pararhizobium sp. YC-54]
MQRSVAYRHRALVDFFGFEEAPPVAERRLLKVVQRPTPLHSFLHGIATFLMLPEAPEIASFIAGKVFHRLGGSGRIRSSSFVQPAPPGVSGAISILAKHNPIFRDLAANLAMFVDDLAWTRGRTGPYASLNFDRNHALATICGRHGLEERADVSIGLVFMEAYSRLPDHTQERNRAFLFLSNAQFSAGDEPWCQASIGTVIANEIGRSFAVRCTAEPMLMLWCQSEQGRS